MLVDFSQLPPRLARAPLNSAAPFLQDRFASSRRNCMATRALIWSRSFPPQRVSFLPRLSVWSEEDEGERKVRVFTNQSALPQERKRAEKQ